MRETNTLTEDTGKSVHFVRVSVLFMTIEIWQRVFFIILQNPHAGWFLPCRFHREKFPSF